MNANPLRLVGALGCGLLFGFGLALSRMVDPAVVRGFLDVTGDWDPSLAGVMAGAIPVTFVFYRIAARRGRALAGGALPPAPERTIDRRLVGGALLFGIGWGLVGLCPAPALIAWLFQPWALLFIAAMVAGMAIQRRVLREPVADPACG
jgi:uncharacterized membrane protein YedE/YeeE